MPLDLSIVIPAYNRVSLLKYTLESVRRAIKSLNTEIVVVDDGSTEPLADQLTEFSDLPISYLRQKNQGLVIAKNNGLRVCRGEYVLFLDSDDLIGKEKLALQVFQMKAEDADVSYTDVASTVLSGSFDSLMFTERDTLPSVDHPAYLYIAVQPPPHGPIYKRSYLTKYLEQPLIKENKLFNPIGEVWMYYNLAVRPAKIIKVEGFHTIVSCHEQERFTQNWERLAVASLLLMLTFAKLCPVSSDTLLARQLVGERALIAWRKLPRNFNAEFEEKMLRMWRVLPKNKVGRIGSAHFQVLSRLIGITGAARLLRRFQRPDYSKIKTILPEELRVLIKALNDKNI